jgi:hypothetical protein
MVNNKNDSVNSKYASHFYLYITYNLKPAENHGETLHLCVLSSKIAVKNGKIPGHFNYANFLQNTSLIANKAMLLFERLIYLTNQIQIWRN